jgi:hypothetical protein
MSYDPPFRLATLALLVVIAGSARYVQSIRADDAKPAKPTVALHCGGAAEDLKVLRETLEKVAGIQLKADEMKYSDFGRGEGLFTKFLTIEIADLAKTDIGTLAKAVSSAKTSNKDKCPPELFLILRYRPDSTSNEPFRAALAKVKGVRPDESWAGDANLWVHVDGGGEARLADIIRALHDASVRFTDPISGND